MLYLYQGRVRKTPPKVSVWYARASIAAVVISAKADAVGDAAACPLPLTPPFRRRTVPSSRKSHAGTPVAVDPVFRSTSVAVPPSVTVCTGPNAELAVGCTAYSSETLPKLVAVAPAIPVTRTLAKEVPSLSRTSQVF